ncbi:hypothetical protein [Crossiella cryophila]|uniref:Exo-alpha-sialidase n=1 Tax=Crossiella cryophila TaxID=43355 RepID=A0A7W7FUC6_9PSEU|nr:hypothetical protein [Crossiella cryophila]MBB4677945.1 hypothetical protein [Crossiella cryophila]
MRRARILLVLLALLATVSPAAQAAPAVLAWQQPWPVGGVASHRPSVAACGGGTYLLWREPSGRLGFATWDQMRRWLPRALTVTTPEVPTLACDNGVLTILWQDTATPPRIQAIRSTTAGQTWSPPQPVGPPGAGVGLAASGGPSTGGTHPFYLAWRGVGADSQLYVAARVGATWQPARAVPGVSSEAPPDIDAFSDRVLLTYLGAQGSVRMSAAGLTPIAWGPFPNPWVGLSTHTPTATPAQSSGGFLAPFVVWKGSGTDTRLHYTARIGTAWQPLTTLTGAATDVDPATAPAVSGGSALWRGVVLVWRNPGSGQLMSSFGH